MHPKSFVQPKINFVWTGAHFEDRWTKYHISAKKIVVESIKCKKFKQKVLQLKRKPSTHFKVLTK